MVVTNFYKKKTNLIYYLNKQQSNTTNNKLNSIFPTLQWEFIYMRIANMRTIIFCKNKNKQYFTRHKNCTTIANNEKYKHYLVQKKLKQHLLQTTNGLFWSRARLKQNYQVPSIGNGDVIITITVWRNNEVVLRVNKCARRATNENLMKFSISILAARQLSLVRLKGSRKGSFSVYQFWVLQHKNRTAKTKKDEKRSRRQTAVLCCEFWETSIARFAL